ncbi:hypothetical protein F4818DRAFT_451022 [Hypoxylon cercidicola]|nr:hypothetical protein F4818DRAFT_451022 [Hypoxylon cercidicola]
MDSNIKPAAPNGPSMPRSRIPLSNKSNASPPHYVPVKTKWDRKDSSEGQPSSHDSIYDAPWVSDTSSATKSPLPFLPPSIPTTATTTTAARPVTPPPKRPIPDPNAESPLSRLEAETPFLYGRGTELAPILEQRSVSTLRTGNQSASDISSLLKHHASATNSNSSPQRPLRRQQSFSLDDLSPSLSSRKRRKDPEQDGADGTSSSGGSSRGSDTGSGAVGVPRLRNTTTRHSPPVVETVDVHAYPQRPAYPPHRAPSTPTGFADWLARHRGRDTFPYPNPTSFRGVRSGHGNLELHPYTRRLGACARHPGEDDGEPAARGIRPPGADADADAYLDPYAPVSAYAYEPRRHRPWTCGACGRPADERWSLLATVMGQGRGRGARRGGEWCSRCAWRKVVYLWCCCEQLGR